MRNTKIEWCDHTVNLWWGCSEVSEACANCYARGIAKRFGKDCWGKSTRWDRRDDAYVEIRKLDAQSKKNCLRETVFVNSMSDFFDNKVPFQWRWEFYPFANFHKNLDFLILTKRPEEIGYADAEAFCKMKFSERVQSILENKNAFGQKIKFPRLIKDKYYLYGVNFVIVFSTLGFLVKGRDGKFIIRFE